MEEKQFIDIKKLSEEMSKFEKELVETYGHLQKAIYETVCVPLKFLLDDLSNITFTGDRNKGE